MQSMGCFFFHDNLLISIYKTFAVDIIGTASIRDF